MATRRSPRNRNNNPHATSATKRRKDDSAVPDPDSHYQLFAARLLSDSPLESLSELPEASAEDYEKAYYDAAVATLDRQQYGVTYQAADAAILYQQLRLATPAESEDLNITTDAELHNHCRASTSLPTLTLVLDRGIPHGAPTSLAGLVNRALEVYGGSNCVFTPQHKSADLTKEFHKQVRVEELANHFRGPGSDGEIWNLLEAGTQIFPQAGTWIPDYVTHDNLLYDIRARAIGTNRANKNTFVDKLSWYLAGDGGAYSPLHFDSHGFGTFLHLLAGELLLVFSNGNETPEDRRAILENIRNIEEFTPDVSAVFQEHLRYMLMRPGQLLYMQPGQLHAVYRTESTLIFGGHYIPKKKLGLWIEKMKEHLKYYDSTNEDPDDVLLYLAKVLELVNNAKNRSLLGDWGAEDEIRRFLVGATDLLEHGAEWIKNDGWESVKGQQWGDEWTKRSKQMLKQHKALLKSVD